MMITQIKSKITQINFQRDNLQSQVAGHRLQVKPKDLRLETCDLRPAASKAVTLIELIMVITIVGILALVAIPRFGSFYFLKISGAMKKVASDIRYVQQLAVSEHTNTKLVFNTAADTYSAQKFNQNTGTWVNITDPFTRGNLSLNFTSDPQYSGIDISGTNLSSSTLRFSWQGFPQEGTDASPSNLTAERSVTFSYKNNSLTIYITPNTARVRIQ